MKKKQDDRPVFKSKLTLTAFLIEAVSFTGLVILLFILAVNWNLVNPETSWLAGLLHQDVPIYGNKSTLLILGSVAVFFYVVLSALIKWPQYMYYHVPINEYNARQHYRMMRTMLRWLKLEIILFTLFLAAIFILISNEMLESFNPTNVLVFIFLIIVTIGIYRHRVKRYNKPAKPRSRPAS